MFEPQANIVQKKAACVASSHPDLGPRDLCPSGDSIPISVVVLLRAPLFPMLMLEKE